MRISLPAMLTALLAMATTSASAADCPQPYTSDDLLTDLEAVEEAAQSNDSSTALQTATKLENGLGCLNEKLVTMLIGRTYRSIGAGFLVGGNENQGRRWFRTAIEVDPNYSFGMGEYGEAHPVRQAYDALRVQPTGTEVRVDGKVFGDGKFYLDGRTLDDPEAIPGRPHLLQRVSDGTTSWVIDGNDFPSEVLTDASAAAGPTPADKPKKQKKSKTARNKRGSENSSGVIEVRPPEKTPLMIAGGALIAGAGGMFVGSILTRQNFDSIENSEADLQRAQRTTNRLYLGSFAVLAVGAGTLTWGVILDGGSPGVRIGGRF